MERIEAEVTDRANLAKATLMWLSRAKDRITLSQVIEVLAVEINESQLDSTNLHEVEDIVAACAGFVIVTTDNSYTHFRDGDGPCHYFQLAHHTISEFLERTQQTWFPTADAQMAHTCLAYLLFKDFCDDFPPRLQPARTLALSVKYPFYRYAAENWGVHCLEGAVQLDDKVFEFLESDSRLIASLDTTRNPRRVEEGDYLPYSSGLHEAIKFGLEDTAIALIQRGHDPTMQIHDYERPLILAARAGLETVVRMLLTFPQVTKTIDEENRDFQTAFFEACRGGNANIIKLLLDSGADPEASGMSSEFSDSLTPLMLAAVRGDESLVATLLSHSRVRPFA
ncbi:Ff.00g055050.m01.CDS01 [Fusarium sp. VM40]|nr:Ff.00g055050.m01.CDS01 [Fusarium sp. VM40]